MIKYTIGTIRDKCMDSILFQSFHDDVIKWKHFCVAGTLWGESIGHRWIPLAKASDCHCNGIGRTFVDSIFGWALRQGTVSILISRWRLIQYCKIHRYIWNAYLFWPYTHWTKQQWMCHVIWGLHQYKKKTPLDEILIRSTTTKVFWNCVNKIGTW